MGGQKKSKVTISEILNKKKNKEKITMLTSYDYSISRICNETDLDMVLIGDSAATVMLGYDSTRKIGMNGNVDILQRSSKCNNKTNNSC